MYTVGDPVHAAPQAMALQCAPFLRTRHGDDLAAVAADTRTHNGEPLDSDEVDALRQVLAALRATCGSGVPDSTALGGDTATDDGVAGARLLLGSSGDVAADCIWSRGFLTPQCVRRYLVAFKWSVKKAYAALLASTAWRAANVPHPALPPVGEFEACVASRYMEWIGHDRKGQPILLIRSRNADLSIPREDRARFLTFAMECGVRMMAGRPGVERWSIIIDETDKAWAHTDNTFLATVAPVVFAHYVERLNRAFIVNPGVLTAAAIGAVKLFVDERTRGKFGSVYITRRQEDNVSEEEGPPTVAEILEALGDEHVPAAYGGTLPDEDLDAAKNRLAAAAAVQTITADEDDR